MIKEKSKIRVVVTYTDSRLEKIEVDSRQLDDIDAIRNKPISEWFSPSNDRFGWKGLLQEINNFLTDEDVALYFDFKGAEEARQIFKEHLEKNGIDPNACLTKEEIINDAIAKAKHAHANGLLNDELQYYLIAADEADSPKAQYEAAKIYLSIHKGQETVVGISRDDALKYAYKYYRGAAKQNHVEAQWKLYLLLKEDESQYEQPNEEALGWLSKAAKAGHFEAQYELGEYHYSKSNFDIAINLLENALENGLADYQSINAKYMLGQCFSNDDCTLKDADKAAEYLIEAANLGHREAQFVIGFEYYLNSEDDENAKEAFSWLIKSAEQGYVEAQYYLATCYCMGIGVDRDDEKALSWFHESAEQGHIKAQYHIGYFYYEGLGVDINREQAVHWYKKAAEQGYAEAQYALARCYSLGEGVDQSDNQAVEWTNLAAEQGHADAQYSLGEFYYNGIVVNTDLEKAIVLFTQAAEQGQIDSLVKLGFCYCYGFGVNKDYFKAMQTFESALQFIDQKSEFDKEDEDNITQIKAKVHNYQGDCYFYGYNDTFKAFEHYLLAANEGNVEAMINVGNCFENNYGTPFSSIDAKKWYLKAMEQGSVEGRKKYKSLLITYATSLYTKHISKFYIGHEADNKIIDDLCSRQKKRVNTEDVIFVLDSSPIKEGKIGVVLTDTHIYQNNIFSIVNESYAIRDIKEISIETIQKKEKVFKRSYFVLNNGRKSELCFDVSLSDLQKEEVTMIINRMLQFLKA